MCVASVEDPNIEKKKFNEFKIKTDHKNSNKNHSLFKHSQNIYLNIQSKDLYQI